MKLLILCFLISSTNVFAQSKVSNKSAALTTGQKEHNCDEPCLKCGHQETCKDTKESDTSRDQKELTGVNEAKKKHQEHQGTEQ